MHHPKSSSLKTSCAIALVAVLALSTTEASLVEENMVVPESSSLHFAEDAEASKTSEPNKNGHTTTDNLVALEANFDEGWRYDRSSTGACWKINSDHTCCETRDPGHGNCIPGNFPSNNGDPGRQCEPLSIVNSKHGWSDHIRTRWDVNYCENWLQKRRRRSFSDNRRRYRDARRRFRDTRRRFTDTRRRRTIASGCYTIKTSAECCKYHDGRPAYIDQPCLPGQWPSGNLCEPEGYKTWETEGLWKPCDWTGWVAPTKQPTFPTCNLHDADDLMKNKETYLGYIDETSAMMQCKDEVDITLPFVTDVDQVMKTIGEQKDAIDKLDEVLDKLKKITDKLYPLLNSIPKVGQVSSVVEKVQKIITTVVGVLKKVVSACNKIHENVSKHAKTALEVVQTGISEFESKATTYFEGMTKAYNCKSRCMYDDELNQSGRLGTKVFEDWTTNGIETTFKKCDSVLSVVNGVPKDLWDKVMGIFNVILPGIDLISGFVNQLMEYVDQLASDAVGLMNAAKCCLPGPSQIHINFLINLFNLLMCPLHAVELQLMKKVKEVLVEKISELIDMLVPDIKFDFSFESPSLNAPIPNICGASSVDLGFKLGLNIDLKGQMKASFQSAMNVQKQNTKSQEVSDIGNMIKETCVDAFAKLTKDPFDTCDCALMGALGDMVGGVAKISGKGLEAARNSGAALGNAASDFNDYAGNHLGESWDSVKNVDYGDALKGLGNTVKSVTSWRPSVGFGEE